MTISVLECFHLAVDQSLKGISKSLSLLGS